MAEIYKDNNTPVSTKIYVKGEPIIVDNEVIVDFYDITNDPLIVPAINPEHIAFSVKADASEVDTGVYSVYIPSMYISRDIKYKLKWEYQYEGNPHTHTTYLDVVTPYISLEEAIEDLGLGSDANDPNYKTYHELRMAEKYARKMVEYYTGQSFYQYDDTFSIMGNDSDILPLPSKILRVHTLKSNDQLLVDNLNNINNIGFNVKPTTSGFGILIDQTTQIDPETYIANGMVPPSIYDVSPNIFRRGKRYDVYGRFGWEDVPDEVEQATIEIMRSYFAKDRLWRDKYVGKISTTDWNFQFTSDAFTGTGSAYADKLLLDFVVTQMVVV